MRRAADGKLLPVVNEADVFALAVLQRDRGHC